MEQMNLPGVEMPEPKPETQPETQPEPSTEAQKEQKDANAGYPGGPGVRSRGNGSAGKLKGKKKQADVRHREIRVGNFTQDDFAISEPTEAQIEAMKFERLAVLKALAEARSGRVRLNNPKRKNATPEDKPSFSPNPNGLVYKDPVTAAAEGFGYVGGTTLSGMECALNAGDPNFDALYGNRQIRVNGEYSVRLPFTSGNTTMVPIPNFLLHGLAELTGTYDEGSTKEDYEYFSVSLGDLLVEAIAGYLAGKCERGSSADLRDHIKYEALARGMTTSDYLFELFDEMGRGYKKKFS